jgi:hypothetical protein
VPTPAPLSRFLSDRGQKGNRTINQAGGLAFVAHSVEEGEERLNGQLEATIKEALDGLRENDVPRELWPMVVAARVEARIAC